MAEQKTQMRVGGEGEDLDGEDVGLWVVPFGFSFFLPIFVG